MHWDVWFQENSWSPGSALGVHDFSTKFEKCVRVRDLAEILEVLGVRWECVISLTKSEKCVGSAWFQENAWSPRSALEVRSALLLRWWKCIGSAWKCVGVRYQWQECVKSAHSNALLFSKGHDAKRFKIRPQICKITATSGFIDSTDTNLLQKPLDCHLNFQKCRWQLNISRFYELQLWSLVKTKRRVRQRSPQNTWLQVDYLCTDDFNLKFYHAVL